MIEGFVCDSCGGKYDEPAFTVLEQNEGTAAATIYDYCSIECLRKHGEEGAA